MYRRFLFLPLFAILTLLLTPAQSFAAPVILAENATVKLPSGHIIKVLSISKVEFSKGTTAIMVRYQTTLSVDQSKALSQEVDDFWKIAVKDIERYNVKEAIISSNEESKGIFFSANHMLNFLYEKGADGKWTRLNRADYMATAQ